MNDKQTPMVTVVLAYNSASGNSVTRTYHVSAQVLLKLASMSQGTLQKLERQEGGLPSVEKKALDLANDLVYDLDLDTNKPKL